MPTRESDLLILDTAALRITARLERAIHQLGLDAPGEFIAIINAIDMQLESRRPSVAAVVHLAEGLRELVQACAIEPSCIRLYGCRRWACVWVDRVPVNWTLITKLIERSYWLVANKRMLTALGGTLRCTNGRRFSW